MKADKIIGIYFSPTGNTAKVVNAIGERIDRKKYQPLDLTRPSDRGEHRTFGPDELLIIGAPVYRGRLPKIMVEELKKMRGTATHVVLLVTYGNKRIDDAIVELKDILEKQGFLPFAAASFPGQHSFNKEIAYNRPDAKDLRIAEEFADKIHEQIEKLNHKKVCFTVPGDRPYIKAGSVSEIPFYPKTSSNCIYCMLCSQYCPAGAISFSNPKEIDPEKCIRCTACIRVCPVQAKQMTPGVYETFVDKITNERSLRRKEPWYFV